ncbi:MAG: thioredoxin family protein [Planctomycetota bacterium]|jgi:thioredoxin 1
MVEDKKTDASLEELHAHMAADASCRCRGLWQGAVVLALVLAVGVVIAGKARRRAAAAADRTPTPHAADRAGNAATPVADNPLAQALATGRPVVADFGRGMCIPCKMMKPILDDLKEQYKGRAEVLIIDIGDHPALAERCSIRTIPTQVFFDAGGHEVYRHEGSMPRDDVVSQLASMGVK